MSQDVRVGVQGTQKKAYVAPQGRRIGISLAEVAFSTTCWDNIVPSQNSDCFNQTCFAME
jgi:hypothetical protein